MIDTRGLYPVVIGCIGGSGSRVFRDLLVASPRIFMDQDCTRKGKDSKKSRKFLDLVDAPSHAVRRLIEEFMVSILDQIPTGKETQYKYFGWKNPRNLLHIEALFEIHSELRFLHLIRDPAAVVRGKRQNKVFSVKRLKGEIEPGVGRDEYILSRWAKVNLTTWERYKDHPQYLLIRYEDILSAPEETVRRIFDWLGVDEFDLNEAVAAIAPPDDAISRGHDVDVSIIAEAARTLGYGCRPQIHDR